MEQLTGCPTVKNPASVLQWMLLAAAADAAAGRIVGK